VPAAGAILDRLLHHAEVIAITGRSYRLQDSVNQDLFLKRNRPDRFTPRYMI
jgi:IstB-like ATP binding protein